MIWLHFIGGRFGNSFRYSKNLVYNTFPVPQNYETKVDNLENVAQEILNERDKFKNSNLSILYNRETMPVSLQKAHQKLDSVVDKLYRKAKFNTDMERIEHLLTMYESMI